jgi:hypothetical protein
VSRRASLPGAEELFRRTSQSSRAREAREAREETKESPQVDKSPKLQVASEEQPPEAREGPRKAPRHQEKITFYCTSEDLMAIESTRLKLRAEYGIAADRGKIVRATLGYVLEDFEARGADSVLVRKLSD